MKMRRRRGLSARSAWYGRGGGRGPVRAAPDEAGQHVEHRGGVLDAAGDGAARVEDVAVRLAEGVGHAPARGLDAVEVAERRGDADRPGAVRPLRDGQEPARHRGAGPPARPSRRVPRVPRVARGRVDVGLRDGHGAHLGGRELAEDDEAAAAQRRRGLVVDGREEGRRRARPEARPGEAHEVEVLDPDGHAVEGREQPPPRRRGGRRPSRGRPRGRGGERPRRRR